VFDKEREAVKGVGVSDGYDKACAAIVLLWR
jgi:hypothetical protein